MRIFLALWAICFFVLTNKASSQTYTPITVTGFNHDIFAEFFPNTTAVTDTVLDLTNHIMYNQAFAATAGLPGGLPNSGFITDASNTRQYQLRPYSGLNALTLMRNTSRILSLATPGSYSKLSLLCFSTENASTVNISLRFTDGSSTPYITNYILADWFFSTANVVISGFGRCQRMAAPPYNPDGFSSNPRFYHLDINLNCADQLKQVDQVIISNVTSTGTNAPFPNAVFLALSGQSYAQNISATTISATCTSANGSATLDVTGTTGPFSVSWNTTPVQTGLTASNLVSDNYTATITDVNNCARTHDVVIAQQTSDVVVSAGATPSAICSGENAQLAVSATGGTLNTHTWSPGNLSGASVSVNPTVTTTYTVTGKDQFGCDYSKEVTLTVNQLPAAPVLNNVQVCEGTQANFSVQGPQAGTTYNWYTTAAGGTAFSTGTSYQTPALTATTTYYVEAVGSTGCILASRIAVTATIVPPPSAPALSGVSICPGTSANLSVQNPQGSLSYNWYQAAAGGTSLHTGTSFQTPAISVTTTYYVEAANSTGCVSNTRTPVSVSMLQPLPKPVVTVSAISSASLSFSWTAVPNATGYEVSIDDGLSFGPPSSGSTGTTHTVSPLNPGQSITIRVRALGPQTCENSALSDPVRAVVPDKNLFVPNVFTPNGDGKNDVLLVFSNSIATMELRIFNQWGQEIFASTNPTKGWDGKFRGQAQPVGVYVYILKATLTDGTVLHKKGSISLIR